MLGTRNIALTCIHPLRHMNLQLRAYKAYAQSCALINICIIQIEILILFLWKISNNVIKSSDQNWSTLALVYESYYGKYFLRKFNFNFGTHVTVLLTTGWVIVLPSNFHYKDWQIALGINVHPVRKRNYLLICSLVRTVQTVKYFNKIFGSVLTDNFCGGFWELFRVDAAWCGPASGSSTTTRRRTSCRRMLGGRRVLDCHHLAIRTNIKYSY